MPVCTIAPYLHLLQALIKIHRVLQHTVPMLNHWMKRNENRKNLSLLPCQVQSKKKAMVLPDPFPLPTNFRPDVEVCLKKRKMTKCTRVAFFTSVSSALFQYKRFSSRDDYVSVARQIVSKYPFLGSAGFGTSYVRHFVAVCMSSHFCTRKDNNLSLFSNLSLIFVCLGRNC